MPRPRLRIGEHGTITATKMAERRWEARAQVRDGDGRVRQVTAGGPTKGAATRALQRKLRERRDPSIGGVTGDMTVAELAAFWLAHRRTHGKARGAGALAEQTLAAYDDAIRLMILPSLAHVRLEELRVGRLDQVLGRIETGADGGRARDGGPGRSTRQARSVLAQMLQLAVRHGAIEANPMALVESTSRASRRELHHLDLDGVRLLRRVVRREEVRVPGRRMPNRDLEEWVDVALGTGARDGEVLGLRWSDLRLDSEMPTAHVCGTVVEPRARYVEQLHRQPMTKTRSDRTLILPGHVAHVLTTRRARVLGEEEPGPEVPVFASRTGHWLSPANIRTRLRRAVAPHPELAGTSPHTLRRTVGTHLAHQIGLDAARDQLGHSDPTVTFQHYVGARTLGPDARSVLDAFFS